MEEKTLAQELRESLCYKPTDATVAMTADEIATADRYCEDYKVFLDAAKTKSEAKRA